MKFVTIPYCHHEKWDGTVTRGGCAATEIPADSRAFSIVERVGRTELANRPYRPAWPQHQVLDYIHYQSGKHFEPEITRVFLEIARGKTNPKPPAPVFRRAAGSALSSIN